MSREDLDSSTLTFIPLALAGWLRYLLEKDDELKDYKASSDPMLDELKEKLSGIVVGDPSSYTGQLNDILNNEILFGVNLEEAGLDNKIETMFTEMIVGKGAVRMTLKKYLA